MYLQSAELEHFMPIYSINMHYIKYVSFVMKYPIVKLPLKLSQIFVGLIPTCLQIIKNKHYYYIFSRTGLFLSKNTIYQFNCIVRE